MKSCEEILQLTVVRQKRNGRLSNQTKNNSAANSYKNAPFSSLKTEILRRCWTICGHTGGHSTSRRAVACSADGYSNAAVDENTDWKVLKSRVFGYCSESISATPPPWITSKRTD